VIKAFGIDEDFDFSVLEAYLNTADYFLFDTKTKAHGGSGKTFNWSVLDRYTDNKPYFLSGGIDLEHTSAIKNINDERLYALDINSRFETEPGLKDAAKIKEFIKEMSTK
jgi:phosphoribosylanthranilate isomerase